MIYLYIFWGEVNVVAGDSSILVDCNDQILVRKSLYVLNVVVKLDNFIHFDWFFPTFLDDLKGGNISLFKECPSIGFSTKCNSISVNDVIIDFRLPFWHILWQIVLLFREFFNVN